MRTRREFRDATGCRMAFDAVPRRIVPLTPALAEQLHALGHWRSVVGVTIRAPHFRRTPGKPSIGNLHYPDVRKIAKLRPDLILASRELNRRETVQALRKRGLKVFVFPAYSSCANVLTWFCMLGRLLGREAKARRLAAQTARTLSRRANRSRPRVFLQVWSRPLMGVAGDSYLHDLVKRCGGRNVLAGRRGHIVACTEQQVVNADPEVILTTLGNAAPEFRRWRRFSQLSAVRNRRLHAIRADWVMPSPLALHCGARKLRKLLSAS